MIQSLTLIGGDHFNDTRSCWWVYEQIKITKPDCITLEQVLSPGGFVPVPFMEGVDKFEQEGRDNPQEIMDPFSAGLIYAIRNNTSLFVIDDYFPNNGYWDTNLTKDEGWKRFLERSKNDKWYGKINNSLNFMRENIFKESTYDNWTRRNEIMARKIEQLHEKGYNRIVHIGGRGHYDPQRCLPLQHLLPSQEVVIVDAVEKRRTSL